MLIFKHKTQSGIFKKYKVMRPARYVYFENIFTGETIGPGGKSKKFDHNLTTSGEWNESGFYVVSEK